MVAVDTKRRPAARPISGSPVCSSANAQKRRDMNSGMRMNGVRNSNRLRRNRPSILSRSTPRANNSSMAGSRVGA
ncbi:hypothetical protein D9M73_280990 [compost metagenome]